MEGGFFVIEYLFSPGMPVIQRIYINTELSVTNKNNINQTQYERGKRGKDHAKEKYINMCTT